MDQVIQILGALLILAAYSLSQFRILSQSSMTYLLANLIGAIVLAILAYQESQWGFLLLEGAWAVISVWGTVTTVQARRG